MAGPAPPLLFFDWVNACAQVCESYGGSDEPVDMLSKSFAEQGAVLPMAPLKVTVPPSL